MEAPAPQMQAWAAATPQPAIGSWLDDEAEKRTLIADWERGAEPAFYTGSAQRAIEAIREVELENGEAEADSDAPPPALAWGPAPPHAQAALELPSSPPAVGPFLRQPCDPPYLLPPGPPGEELVAGVLSVTEALRSVNALRTATPGRVTLANNLALALSDARLLDSHLFRTIRGRMAIRRALAALRASHDPRLARGVLQALVAALQRAGQAPLSAGEAEVLTDHATALLLAGTVEMPRASEDLFALDWELTSRLLGRVQQLANEHAESPGPLRPKASLFHGLALDRFERKEEAIGHYFEAWSELQRRHMTPSPLEAALIPALAELQYGTRRIKSALHITGKCYVLQGGGTEAAVSQFLALHSQVTACRVVMDVAGSSSLSARALEVVRGLGPGHDPIDILSLAGPFLARILHVHATDLLVTGRLFAGRRLRLEALRLLAALDDPALPDLDWMAHQETGTMVQTMRPALRARIHSGAIRVVKVVDPGERTPMLAHLLLRRALALRDDGKPGAAGERLVAALRAYRTGFPHVFPEGDPRIRVRSIRANARQRYTGGKQAMPVLDEPGYRSWLGTRGLRGRHPRVEALLAELRAGAPERPPPLSWRGLLRLPLLLRPDQKKAQVAPTQVAAAPDAAPTPTATSMSRASTSMPPSAAMIHSEQR
eukprot:tig00020510_g9918.t1